jgi:phenylacetate-CoA ligase
MLNDHTLRTRCAELARSPGEPRSTLLEKQGRRLVELIRHAQAQVPYYARFWAEYGVDVRTFHGLPDLARLPILSREQFQKFGETTLLARGASPNTLLPMRSSGSTGRPILVLHAALERALYVQFRARTFALLGPELKGKITYIGMDARTTAEKQIRLKERLTVVECRRDCQSIWNELVASAPQVLVSYPGVLAELAREIPEGQLRALGLDLIVASGEVLTPAIEEQVSAAFSARVTATYASSEFFWMGGRCRDTGQYHVVDDSVILEVINDQGLPAEPGEEGEVVGTALHSFAQPLLRYRIGDRAIMGDAPTLGAVGCACGSPFSTLRSVIGRSLDFVTLPGGRRVHAYELTIPLRSSAPFIDQYRVIQDSTHQIRIVFVPNREPTDAETAALVMQLSAAIPGLEIVFERVAHLPRGVNGKFRLVESHVT